MLFSKPAILPDAASAMPGRSTPMPVSNCHVVHGRPYQPPLPVGLQQLVVGMGCFWGAERVFWRLQGVYSTAVGYAGGFTPNPTYEEVCSGRTGHTEVVIVFYDPQQINRQRLQEVFWESHDPTQGMRQGNDRGTQYRSALYVGSAEELAEAQAGAQRVQGLLSAAGFGTITTEIKALDAFYYAEDYHQQYLARNPNGYCGIKGLGITCPLA
jgi:peptide-methionine (S)-S-oxide reductase